MDGGGSRSYVVAFYKRRPLDLYRLMMMCKSGDGASSLEGRDEECHGVEHRGVARECARERCAHAEQHVLARLVAVDGHL